MASRWLRASGNWNDAVWASTSGGAAGSAATPTAVDDIYILNGLNVTLTEDTTVKSTYQYAGSVFYINGYSLTVTGNTSVSAGTLDLGGGKLYAGNHIYIGGSLANTTGSFIQVDRKTGSGVGIYCATPQTFGDVIINIGVGTSASLSTDITGSPTFRSLVIQSKNSAAHTVNFEDVSTVSVSKFVAIGSSSSNKLSLETDGMGSMNIDFADGGTSYGQYVQIMGTSGPFPGFVMPTGNIPFYIGSNSALNPNLVPGDVDWLLQNPPKISTLVDPLTTAPGSNPNWTVGGTVTSVTTGRDGGGYQFASGAGLVSTDTYDAVSSSINFQTISSTSLKFNTPAQAHSLVANKFYKFSVSTGGAYLLENSDDGGSWTAVSSQTVEPNIYRSMRVSFDGVGVIGTVNSSFNQSPTTALGTPADNTTLTTTTPTLSFTGTDPEGDQVSYQIQVSTASSFASTHMDVTTTTYASGTQQTRVVSPALTEGSIDYWWRVRAKDPSGSNTYGAWSTARKMTTAALPPTVTSGASSSITTTTADVAGNVTADGGATITERGFVYATTTSPTTASSKKAVAGTTGAFNTSLTALTPNTLYYWRAYAINAKGTVYGSNQSFTTLPRPPVVATGASGGTSYNQFTVSGSGVTSNPDSQTISEFGIVYATTENPTIANSKQVGTGTSANYANTVTGLADSTTYYIRAYAKWGTNYAYGSQVSLTTPAPPSPPTVTTAAATSIIDTRVDIVSNVTASGDGTVSERGVVFGLTANPTVSDGKATSITGGTGEYSLRITGLTPNTTYHYRAYAINEYGTGYSTDSTFTTLAELVPDTGDGYWTFSSTGSTAVVSRSQATGANASVNLALADLPQIEDGQTYTLHVGDITKDYGNPKVRLLYYNGASPVTQDIAANTEYTFAYNLTTYNSYYLQLFVTSTAESNPLTATFNDLYLAKEPTFSEFIEYAPRGVTEVKIINNEIIDDRRTQVIDSIYDKLVGYEYTPFEAETEGLGYFEIYDGIDINDGTNTVSVINLESKLTIDGGISETLKGTAPDKTETEYSRAGNIKKLISNTTLKVDKQRQEIEALVADVYDNDGYIEEKFSQVLQDIDEVRTTVQGAGGVNLIRNSAMYAYNNLGYPDSWTTTHVGGASSTITIQGSPESKTAGGISGNAFTLKGTKVVQNVPVRKDTDSISAENKTYYSFNVKVKKNLVGAAYIKLSNRQETHQLDLPTGEDYFWDNFTISGLLPQDGYYDIELYSDMDAQAQFTDAMLSIGEYTHSWTQAPGEVGNASVSITEDGITLRQDQFRYNYTHIDALGFNVHKKVLGTQEQIFGFNSDETNVSAIKSDKHIKMGGIMVVPITISGESGWAFTPSGDN